MNLGGVTPVGLAISAEFSAIWLSKFLRPYGTSYPEPPKSLSESRFLEVAFWKLLSGSCFLAVAFWQSLSGSRFLEVAFWNSLSGSRFLEVAF
jgi:hypothetical protein